MMKRLLRNFIDGRDASITVVFQADMPVDVRWYRLDTSYSSRGSEIQNMLPVPKGGLSFKHIVFNRNGLGGHKCCRMPSHKGGDGDIVECL